MNCDGGSSGSVTRGRSKRLKLMEQLEVQNDTTQQTDPQPVQGPSPNTKGQKLKKKVKVKVVTLKHDQGIQNVNAETANQVIATSDVDLENILGNLVCSKHLLSFLHVNDLLRLRRVCKSSNNSVQDFIRSQKVETAEPLKINFGDASPLKTFNRFEKDSIYLPTRTHLELTFGSINPIWKPLTKCTHYVTHLTIFGRQIPTHSNGNNFLESFPNVTHLELGNIERGRGEIPIPSSFRNLKSLKILENECDQIWTQRSLACIVKLVEASVPTLEHISLPFNQLWFDLNYPVWGSYPVIRLACTCIFHGATNLKLDGMCGDFMDELLKPYGRTSEMGTLDDMMRNMNVKMISIKNPQPPIFLNEFPHLENIEFEITSEHTLPPTGFLRSDWPKLKEIKVNVRNCCDHVNLMHNFHQIWNVLFVGIVRENVVHMEISCDKLCQPYQIFPNSRDISTSCPNLKTLYIGWHFPRVVNLPQLWRGLPRLQRLRFYTTHDLKDEDLVGEDAESPAFWSLKNLKVLEFINMEVMDNMTDDLFTKVLCHMPLKELKLTSFPPNDDRVKSISLKGIRSLLNGKFATTVERLSISSLRIKYASTEKLRELETQFRSFKMY